MKKPKKVYTDDQKRIVKAIMAWRAYVKIDRVSSSGMTRYMKVYLHNRNWMENITHTLNEVLERGMDKYWNIKVWWCGMDMCMHLLYTYLWSIKYDYARKRNQVYHNI